MGFNLPDEPFTLKDALVDYELTRYKVLKLVNEGTLVKIGHGLYQKVKSQKNLNYDTTKFVKAFARAKGEGCVCLWSALEFYDLTEEFIERVWIYVPYSKIIRDADVRPIRKRNINLNSGIVSHVNFNITSIERTLVDCFLSKKHISLKDSLEITRNALKAKKTNLTKISKIAKEMEVFEKVREYLGLLS